MAADPAFLSDGLQLQPERISVRPRTGSAVSFLTDPGIPIAQPGSRPAQNGTIVRRFREFAPLTQVGTHLEYVRVDPCLLPEA